MKKVLLIDTNYGFTSDLESRLILSDLDDYDFTMLNNVDNIPGAVNQAHPDEILVAAGLLTSNPDWNFQIPVKSYARKAEEMALSKEYGIPCYGIMQRAAELLTAIESGITVQIGEGTAVQTGESVTESPEISAPERMEKESEAAVNEDILSMRTEPQTTPVTPSQYVATSDVQPGMAPEKQPQETHRPFRPEPEPVPPEPQAQAAPPEKQVPPTPVTSPYSYPAQNQETGYQAAPFQANAAASSTSRGMDLRKQLAAAREKEEAEQRRREAEAAGRLNVQAEQAVNLALGNVRKPAKTIAVYSAKGGVGKTTIASELATYLALVNTGRTNFKVCVADFDIDFGDVLNTLSFDPNKACMSLWAADIRERLNALPLDVNGMHTQEQLDSIQYTENEISVFLQHNEQDGLYALLAPISNEDSMDISEEEVEIMMDNLIKNGGFDFVICDTGNNTKDSSFLALEKADEILLIHTQSVNTVNCNAGLLSMLQKINFDLNKIKLIVNKAKPAKSVGVSIQEVQEALINPSTGKPYPCIAVIKNTDDANHSNNTGEPLVYKSSHEFTKSIAEIAKEVIDEDFRLQPRKKKGLFSRMFGKN